MPVRPKQPKSPPVHHRSVPVPVGPTGVKNHANISAKGDKLIAKLVALAANKEIGVFSLSFTEAKSGKQPWLGALVGVGAVDKLENGVDGGRKMKAILMVRVPGRGMKITRSGVRSMRVPAKGAKPVAIESLKDIERLLASAKHTTTRGA